MIDLQIAGSRLELGDLNTNITAKKNDDNFLIRLRQKKMKKSILDLLVLSRVL